MSNGFDMELFLAGVMTGSPATRQRQLRQAMVIQIAIAARWQRNNPWTWKRKHLVWFLNHSLNLKTEATRYYYRLTAQLIAEGLKKSWFES